MLACILHYIYREAPNKDQLEMIQLEGLDWEPVLFEVPAVWHGFAAAAFLKLNCGIADEDFRNDVRKILLLYPGAQELREACRESIHKGMTACLKYSVSHLAEKEVPIVKYTWEAFNQTILSGEK